MNTPTLFAVGLVAGAIAVFGIRAASLDGADHGGASSAEQPAQGDGSRPDPAGFADASVRVILDADGKFQSALMVMPDGSTHAIAAGSHAPMGDFPAHIQGREGAHQVHLHAHSEHELELTLMTDEGDLVAQHTFGHAASAAEPATGQEPEAPSGADAKQPENRVCPVMGNPVDPEVYVDYQGRRIGFCCPGCDELFLKDPAKYLKKVDAELAARKESK